MKTIRELALKYNLTEYAVRKRFQILKKEGYQDFYRYVQLEGNRNTNSLIFTSGGESMIADNRFFHRISTKTNEDVISFLPYNNNKNFTLRFNIALTLREAKLKDVAESTGIKYISLQTILRNHRRYITKEELKKISEFFRVGEDWFLETNNLIDISVFL